MNRLMKNISSFCCTREGGFGILEAMIAMVIVSIGVLACYKLQLQSTSSNALSDRVSSSTAWATYALERLMALDYDDPLLNDNDAPADGIAGLDAVGADADNAAYVSPDGSVNTVAAADDLYSVFWNVAQGTALETDVLRDVKQIRIIVMKNAGIGNGILYTHDYFKTEEF